MNRQSNATAKTILITTKTAVQPFSHGSQRQRLSWVKRIVVRLALTGVSLSLVAGGKAEAISFTFEKIVDTDTPIPGDISNFEAFEAPSLDDGNVAFMGGTLDSQKPVFQKQGIYTNIGNRLNIIADENTDAFFSKLSLDNRTVAFIGYSFSGQQSIYTSDGSKLNVIVDTNTPIPGGTGNFQYFYGEGPSLNNGNVAFTGYGSDQDGSDIYGIYTNIDGKLNTVVDTSTSIPGSTNTFNGFSGPSLDNGNMAFVGYGSDRDGIYTSINGKLNVIADTGSSIPGSAGTFEYFNYPPSLDDGNVAFGGSGSGQDGIYTSIDGKLNVIADRNTSVPDGTGTFDYFEDLSLDGRNVAFLGLGDEFGVYTNIGGTLTKVISTDDLLDGKEILQIKFSPEGLSGNQIAFTVNFNDDALNKPVYSYGSEAIYVATAVPEPSSVLSILASGTFGTGWLLKRRQKSQSVARHVNFKA